MIRKLERLILFACVALVCSGCSLHVHFDKHYHGEQTDEMSAEQEISNAFETD